MGIISINEKSGRTGTMKRVFILVYIAIFSLLLLPNTQTSAATDQSTITIKAFCVYSYKYGTQTVYAEKNLTLITPAPSGAGPSIVYLTGCWRRVKNASGQWNYVYDCPIADGWAVRAFVWVSGVATLVDGIQNADGTVEVNGKIYERVPGI